MGPNWWSTLIRSFMLTPTRFYKASHFHFVSICDKQIIDPAGAYIIEIPNLKCVTISTGLLLQNQLPSYVANTLEWDHIWFCVYLSIKDLKLKNFLDHCYLIQNSTNQIRLKSHMTSFQLQWLVNFVVESICYKKIKNLVFLQPNFKLPKFHG